MKKTLIAICISILLSACGSSANNDIFASIDVQRNIEYQQLTDDNNYIYTIAFDVGNDPIKVSYFLEYHTEWFVKNSENYTDTVSTDPVELKYNHGYLINEKIYDRSWQAHIWETSIIILIEYSDRTESHKITEYGG